MSNYSDTAMVSQGEEHKQLLAYTMSYVPFLKEIIERGHKLGIQDRHLEKLQLLCTRIVDKSLALSALRSSKGIIDQLYAKYYLQLSEEQQKNIGNGKELIQLNKANSTTKSPEIMSAMCYHVQNSKSDLSSEVPAVRAYRDGHFPGNILQIGKVLEKSSEMMSASNICVQVQNSKSDLSSEVPSVSASSSIKNDVLEKQQGSLEPHNKPNQILLPNVKKEFSCNQDFSVSRRLNKFIGSAANTSIKKFSTSDKSALKLITDIHEKKLHNPDQTLSPDIVKYMNNIDVNIIKQDIKSLNETSKIQSVQPLPVPPKNLLDLALTPVKLVLSAKMEVENKLSMLPTQKLDSALLPSELPSVRNKLNSDIKVLHKIGAPSESKFISALKPGTMIDLEKSKITRDSLHIESLRPPSKSNKNNTDIISPTVKSGRVTGKETVTVPIAPNYRDPRKSQTIPAVQDSTLLSSSGVSKSTLFEPKAQEETPLLASMNTFTNISSQQKISVCNGPTNFWNQSGHKNIQPVHKQFSTKHNGISNLHQSNNYRSLSQSPHRYHNDFTVDNHNNFRQYFPFNQKHNDIMMKNRQQASHKSHDYTSRSMDREQKIIKPLHWNYKEHGEYKCSKEKKSNNKSSQNKKYTNQNQEHDHIRNSIRDNEKLKNMCNNGTKDVRVINDSGRNKIFKIPMIKQKKVDDNNVQVLKPKKLTGDIRNTKIIEDNNTKKDLMMKTNKHNNLRKSAESEINKIHSTQLNDNEKNEVLKTKLENHTSNSSSNIINKVDSKTKKSYTKNKRTDYPYTLEIPKKYTEEKEFEKIIRNAVKSINSDTCGPITRTRSSLKKKETIQNLNSNDSEKDFKENKITLEECNKNVNAFSHHTKKYLKKQTNKDNNLSKEVESEIVENKSIQLNSNEKKEVIKMNLKNHPKNLTKDSRNARTIKDNNTKKGLMIQTNKDNNLSKDVESEIVENKSIQLNSNEKNEVFEENKITLEECNKNVNAFSHHTKKYLKKQTNKDNNLSKDVESEIFENKSIQLNSNKKKGVIKMNLKNHSKNLTKDSRNARTIKDNNTKKGLMIQTNKDNNLSKDVESEIVENKSIQLNSNEKNEVFEENKITLEECNKNVNAFSHHTKKYLKKQTNKDNNLSKDVESEIVENKSIPLNSNEKNEVFEENKITLEECNKNVNAFSHQTKKYLKKQTNKDNNLSKDVESEIVENKSIQLNSNEKNEVFEENKITFEECNKNVNAFSHHKKKYLKKQTNKDNNLSKDEENKITLEECNKNVNAFSHQTKKYLKKQTNKDNNLSKDVESEIVENKSIQLNSNEKNEVFEENKITFEECNKNVNAFSHHKKKYLKKQTNKDNNLSKDVESEIVENKSMQLNNNEKHEVFKENKITLEECNKNVNAFSHHKKKYLKKQTNKDNNLSKDVESEIVENKSMQLNNNEKHEVFKENKITLEECNKNVNAFSHHDSENLNKSIENEHNIISSTSKETSEVNHLTEATCESHQENIVVSSSEINSAAETQRNTIQTQIIDRIMANPLLVNFIIDDEKLTKLNQFLESPEEPKVSMKKEKKKRKEKSRTENSESSSDKSNFAQVNEISNRVSLNQGKRTVIKNKEDNSIESTNHVEHENSLNNSDNLLTNQVKSKSKMFNKPEQNYYEILSSRSKDTNDLKIVIAKYGKDDKRYKNLGISNNTKSTNNQEKSELLKSKKKCTELLNVKLTRQEMEDEQNNTSENCGEIRSIQINTCKKSNYTIMDSVINQPPNVIVNSIDDNCTTNVISTVPSEEIHFKGTHAITEQNSNEITCGKTNIIANKSRGKNLRTNKTELDKLHADISENYPAVIGVRNVRQCRIEKLIDYSKTNIDNSFFSKKSKTLNIKRLNLDDKRGKKKSKTTKNNYEKSTLELNRNTKIVKKTSKKETVTLNKLKSASITIEQSEDKYSTDSVNHNNILNGCLPIIKKEKHAPHSIPKDGNLNGKLKETSTKELSVHSNNHLKFDLLSIEKSCDEKEVMENKSETSELSLSPEQFNVPYSPKSQKLQLSTEEANLPCISIPESNMLQLSSKPIDLLCLPQLSSNQTDLLDMSNNIKCFPSLKKEKPAQTAISSDENSNEQIKLMIENISDTRELSLSPEQFNVPYSPKSHKLQLSAEEANLPCISIPESNMLQLSSKPIDLLCLPQLSSNQTDLLDMSNNIKCFPSLKKEKPAQTAISSDENSNEQIKLMIENISNTSELPLSPEQFNVPYSPKSHKLQLSAEEANLPCISIPESNMLQLSSTPIDPLRFPELILPQLSHNRASFPYIPKANRCLPCVQNENLSEQTFQRHKSVIEYTSKDKLINFIVAGSSCELENTVQPIMSTVLDLENIQNLSSMSQETVKEEDNKSKTLKSKNIRIRRVPGDNLSRHSYGTNDNGSNAAPTDVCFTNQKDGQTNTYQDSTIPMVMPQIIHVESLKKTKLNPRKKAKKEEKEYKVITGFNMWTQLDTLSDIVCPISIVDRNLGLQSINNAIPFIHGTYNLIEVNHKKDSLIKERDAIIHQENRFYAMRRIKSQNFVQKAMSKPQLFGLYKCLDRQCSEIFNSKDEFQLHIKHHFQIAKNKKKVIRKYDTEQFKKCAYCFKSFDDEVTLANHIDETYTFCKFGCPYCFYRAYHPSHVLVHQSLIHKQSVMFVYKIKFTIENSPNRSEMLNVINYSKYVHTYPCNVGNCNFKCYVKSSFISHLSQEHQECDKYCCSICAKENNSEEFFDLSTFINHFESHNINLYQCIFCLFGTELVDSMMKHLAVEHFEFEPLCLCRSHLKTPKIKYKGDDIGNLKIIRLHKAIHESMIENVTPSTENFVRKFRPTTKRSSRINKLPQLSNAIAQNKDVEVIVIDDSDDDSDKSKKVENISTKRKISIERPIDASKRLKGLAQNKDVSVVISDDEGSKKNELTSLGDDDKSDKVGNISAKRKQSIRGSICQSNSPKRLVTSSTILDRLFVCRDCDEVCPDAGSYLLHIGECQIFKIKDSADNGNQEGLLSSDTIDSIPKQFVFSKFVRCSLCPYSTKVQSNFLNHLRSHREGQINTTKDLVNPVQCIGKSELMFDKMINLSSSSFEVMYTEQMKIDKLNKKIVEEFPRQKLNMELYPCLIPKNERFKCSAHYCSYTGRTSAMLMKHYTILHKTNTVYVCPHCTSLSSSQRKTVYLKHAEFHLMHHGENLYGCQYCTYIHFNRIEMKTHMRNVHESEITAANQSNIIVIRQTQADDDCFLDRIEPTKCTISQWICNICATGKKYTENEIRCHIIKTHHIYKMFKCPMCMFEHNDDSYKIFNEHYKLLHPSVAVKCLRVFEKIDDFNKQKKQSKQSANAKYPLEQQALASIDPTIGPRTCRGIPIYETFKKPCGVSESAILTTKTPPNQAQKLKLFTDNFSKNDSLGTITSNGKFTCPRCNKYETTSKELFHQHLLKDVNYRKWRCLKCFEICDSPQKMAWHVKKHEDGTKYENIDDEEKVQWVSRVLLHQNILFDKYQEQIKERREKRSIHIVEKTNNKDEKPSCSLSEKGKNVRKVPGLIRINPINEYVINMEESDDD